MDVLLPCFLQSFDVGLLITIIGALFGIILFHINSKEEIPIFESMFLGEIITFLLTMFMISLIKIGIWILENVNIIWIC